ncbi:MAG: DUF1684 domain-containing protein [Crocinitomix sp.]|nr:DUF1684 domain-containing protein [Crocinitomix sp.]
MTVLGKLESFKGLLFTLAVLFAFNSFGQRQAAGDTELYKSIEEFQAEQDEHYFNKKTSPLTRKERRNFKGHNFYTVDLSYVVEAKFNKIVEEDTVELMSSSGNVKYYRPYATLTFKIAGVECELIAFQSMRLREVEEYKNYLLLPFRDVTSGSSSYGGGRYLDIEIPSANTITLNFNLAYNPYCAYTSGYNCTVPPKENTLPVAIKAGLKAPADH